MNINPVLHSLKPYLIEDIQYKHIGDYLVKKGIISQKEDYDIFQLVGKAKIIKLLGIIEQRDGATRELINALKQPNVFRLYKDLVQKLESASVPSSPSPSPSPTGSGVTYVFRHNPGTNGSVKPEKIVERRHFNDIVKILKQDILKWKPFYESLGLDQVEMFSTAHKLLKNEIQPSQAYRDVLDAWKENAGRDATFGILDDVLRNQINWPEAADDIDEKYWD